MHNQITVKVHNNSGQDITYHGLHQDTNQSTWTVPAIGTVIKNGSEQSFSSNRKDSYLRGHYGILWFSIPDQSASAGGIWSKSFFVGTWYFDRNNYKYGFTDAGWCDQLDLRPVYTPPFGGYDEPVTPLFFPQGKIGISSSGFVKPDNAPSDVTVTINPYDVPVISLKTGGGHDRWMTDLLSNSTTLSFYGPKPISALYIPGSHDAATWDPAAWQSGLSGPTIRNAKCQSLSLYQQLKLGIRYLDLRLTPSTDAQPTVFLPFHGLLRRTAPDFNTTLDNIGSASNTLLSQLDIFYQETVGSAEFVIIQFTLGGFAGYGNPTKVPTDFTPTDDCKNNFWSLIHHYFHDKTLSFSGSLPTLNSMKGSGQRFLLHIDKSDKVKPTSTAPADVQAFYDNQVWGSSQGFLKGPGWNPGVYEQSSFSPSDWKHDTIIKFIEDYMKANQPALKARDHFTGYQCQVTPGDGVINAVTFSPGGIGFAPDFNPRLQQLLSTDLWLDCASIISGDFFDGPTIERIIGMHYKRIS